MMNKETKWQLSECKICLQYLSKSQRPFLIC